MKKIILGLFISMLATAAFANDAGCGLGSLVIKSNGKLTQLFAVTTNGTSGSQTLGITSGTSGCTSSGLVKNDKEIQYFVEINQEDLTREMAQGHGEKLNTLASLYGCSSEANTKQFASSAQSNFANIVPTAQLTATELVTNLQSSSVSRVCTGG
ncbi:MAG: DUF3015 family protein [Pseudobdellovibrionaceae bacterium]